MEGTFDVSKCKPAASSVTMNNGTAAPATIDNSDCHTLPNITPDSSPGLSDQFGVLTFGNFVSPSNSPFQTGMVNRFVTKPKSRSMPGPNLNNNVRVIAMDENIAIRIEQERKRARGSIYSQRSRDKSRVAATTARLQREISQLHGQISNLDANIATIGMQAGNMGVPVNIGMQASAPSSTIFPSHGSDGTSSAGAGSSSAATALIAKRVQQPLTSSASNISSPSTASPISSCIGSSSYVGLDVTR